MVNLAIFETLLNDVDGAAFIGLDTEVSVTLKGGKKNEFQGQSKEVDYIKNLNSDPSYFPVLIYVSPVSLQIKEQMADTLIALILELILESENKHLRIEEIINDIAQEMVSLNPAIELFEFKKAVLSKIRFMLYQGILEFEKCI
jgi:hypothetical protein